MKNHELDSRFNCKTKYLSIGNPIRLRHTLTYLAGNVIYRCPTTRNHGDTNLKLSLSQHLINLIHGMVYAENIIGNGNKFYFIVQLDGSQEPIILSPV